MMKKLLSLTLAMVTALGLMLPASAAEETTDEALARVTQAVKAALDLDTDAYDEFQGSWYEDGLTGAWDLYWSTGLGSATIWVCRIPPPTAGISLSSPRGMRPRPPGPPGTFWTRSCGRGRA